MRIRIRLFLCSFILACSSALPASNPLVVKAGKIYTVSDGMIENGMLLVEDGKIVSVGTRVSIPNDAEILEANVVIPGLIDIHSHLGVYSVPLVDENSDGNEMTDPITPQVRAMDSFNFDDPGIEAGRKGGVTTVISRPGSGNIIGGTSVAVKLKDAPPDEMILEEICDLKMAIEGNPIGVYSGRNQMPSTLMAVYHMAEKAFLEAQDYMKEWEEHEKKKGGENDAGPPKRDLSKEALAMALRGDIPVHIHCATASEIMSSIRLARKFGLKLSLGHAYWAHLLIDELEEYRDVHFNIGPPMFFSWYDNPLSFRNNPAILANHGFKVSLQTDAIGVNGGQQNLRHLATLCVRYGMNEDDALRSITLTAAEGVGLDDRIGSIEKGKDADLVFLTGEPFDMFSEVRSVIIDGEIVYQNDAIPSLAPPHEPGARALSLPENLAEAKKIAIAGGLVYTMAGDPIENGVVLIDDGRIRRVGRDLSIPGGYAVIDATGNTVMPGLVSPRSYIGIGSNWRRQSHIDETSKSVVPALYVKHAIEPGAPAFSFARELGVTTTLVTPGNRNVIGGRGAVLKTTGNVVDKMIVAEEAVMMMGLGASAKRENQMPTTRMGVAALLRETLMKAREYEAKVDAHKGNGEGDPPKKDWDMEALLPVIRGETPVLVHAERLDDIYTAVRIADEFGLKMILDGGTDAYRMIDALKEREIPVILEDLFRGIGQIEDQGFNPETPKLLSEAGIRVAFRSNISTRWTTPNAGSPGGDLLEIAAFAVKNGMDPEAALRAITIEAARIIGMDDRVGSIEPGKDADLLILGGHPLATTAIPEAVFIQGRLVYRRDAGARLMAGGRR